MAHLQLICPLKWWFFIAMLNYQRVLKKWRVIFTLLMKWSCFSGTVRGAGLKLQEHVYGNCIRILFQCFWDFLLFEQKMWQDISMWIPEEFVDNDLFEMIRDEGGDQVRAGGGEKSHNFFWRNPGRKRHFQPKFARYNWYPGRVRNTFVWDGYLRILNLSNTTALNIHTQNPEMV